MKFPFYVFVAVFERKRLKNLTIELLSDDTQHSRRQKKKEQKMKHRMFPLIIKFPIARAEKRKKQKNVKEILILENFA